METRREAGDSKKALLKDKKGLRQRKEKDKHKRKRSTRLHFPPLRWELGLISSLRVKLRSYVCECFAYTQQTLASCRTYLFYLPVFHIK